MLKGVLFRFHRLYLRITKLRHYSVFIRIMNPLSGNMEWLETDAEKTDYARAIARSAYADMLHDSERNEKYFTSLRAAINKMHTDGRKANVLDIGTGSGLLAMMAARSGADSVYACEMFDVMANCAKRVIDANGLSDKIKVISKRSQDLIIGEDMPIKANILVAEVFDTELIGEGAISVFNHASVNLLEECCIVIPSKARVYAQIYDSKVLHSSNKMDDIVMNESRRCLIKMPDNIKNCPGVPSVHDIQLSELPTSYFRVLCQPQVIEEFDFRNTTDLRRTVFKTVTSETSGTAHGVFLWWDLIMDPITNTTLSCAPNFVRDFGDSGNIELPWRDHWMQAVYYFPTSLSIETDKTVTLISNRDEYSWWFNMQRGEVDHSESNTDQKYCTCTLHYCSRTYIGMLNDKSRWSKFYGILSKIVNEHTVCVCLSEASLLGICVANLGAKMVYQLSSGLPLDDAFEQIAFKNISPTKFKFEKNVRDMRNQLNASKSMATLVVADPHFMNSILPLDDIKLWNQRNQLKNVLSNGIRIIPSAGKMFILPVQFDHLWKIRAPVGKICGFNLEPFDELIQDSINKADETLDAQPLWEYPCIALAYPKESMSLHFTKRDCDRVIHHDTIDFHVTGKCDGIVVWIEWLLSADEHIKISTGPVEPVIAGERIKWDMFSKQGVHFIRPPIKVTPTSHYLEYRIIWNMMSASLQYDFIIRPKLVNNSN